MIRFRKINEQHERIAMAALLSLLFLISFKTYIGFHEPNILQELNDGGIVEIVLGEDNYYFSVEDLYELPVYCFNIDLLGRSLLTRNVMCEGVRVFDILDYFGFDTENLQAVRIVGVNTMIVELSAEELRADDLYYLTIFGDGEFLSGKASGGPGPFMLASPAGPKCKNVVRIELIY